MEQIITLATTLKLEVTIGDTLTIGVGKVRTLRLREGVRLSSSAMSRLAGMIIDCLLCYASVGGERPQSAGAICSMVDWRLASESAPLPRAAQRAAAMAIRHELRRVLSSEEDWLVDV